MMPIGLRMLWRAGWEARARAGFVAVGMAIGMSLLLLALGAVHALGARDTRSAWMYANQSEELAVPAQPGGTKNGSFLWFRSVDAYGSRPLYRFSIATPGGVKKDILGMKSIPKDGEYYVSPALNKAMNTAPADQLRNRFKGVRIGTIDEKFLPSPDALIAIEGRGVQELEMGGGTVVLSDLPRQSPPYSALLKTLMAIAAAGILMPIVVLMSTAARMSAVERLQRFVTLRLIGATPGQVGALMAFESGLTAVVGAMVGCLLYLVLYPLVARVSVGGGSFFHSDFVLSAPLVAVIVVATVVLAVSGALVSVLRIWHSVLESQIAKANRRVRAWRIIPLVVGFGVLEGLIMHHPKTSSAYVKVGVPLGFILVLWGIVLAGPLLVRWMGVFVGWAPRSAARLIAGRHLGAAPRVVFRNLSGVVMAVFVVSVFMGLSEGIAHYLRGPSAGVLPADTVALQLSSPIEDRTQVSDLERTLQGVEGVHGVAEVYDIYPRGGGETVHAIRCDQVHTLEMPSCYGRLDDLSAQRVSTAALFAGDGESAVTPGSIVTLGHNASDVSVVSMFLVRTDNDTSTVNRLRTVASVGLSLGSAVQTKAEIANPAAPLILQMQQFAFAGMAVSIIIATLSLLVAAAGSVLERRRPFGLLRLTGVPVSQLSWSLVQETAVPLLCAVAFASCLGYAIANMLLKVFAQGHVVAPSLAYYAVVGGCYVVSVAILCAILPFLRIVTKEVRFE